MLEQRRAKEKGYITLKEAAEIANYTPDYVGQLIRAGKIKGEQVYSNVAWVTTEKEIQAYLTDKGRVISAPTHVVQNTISHIIFKCLLYTVITLIACMLFFLQYVLYVSIDDRIGDLFANTAMAESSNVTSLP